MKVWIVTKVKLPTTVIIFGPLPTLQIVGVYKKKKEANKVAGAHLNTIARPYKVRKKVKKSKAANLKTTHSHITKENTSSSQTPLQARSGKKSRSHMEAWADPGLVQPSSSL